MKILGADKSAADKSADKKADKKMADKRTRKGKKTVIRLRTLPDTTEQVTVTLLKSTGKVPICMYEQNDKLREDCRDDRRLKKLLRAMERRSTNPRIEDIDKGFALLLKRGKRYAKLSFGVGF